MSIRTTPPDSELESEFSDHLALASEQRRELMAAQAIDFDLDFAFNLQLQEAITASLSVDPQPSISSAAICQPGPSTSSAAVSQSHPDEQASSVSNILSDELLKLEEELKDQAVSESEFKKLKNDLHRRIHDQRMALEISTMSEDEWEDWGNEFERPFGEGSSEGVNDETFRLYFKGLVEKQLPDGVFLGGIGIAICDSRDELLFELRKPLVGDRIGQHSAELRALIEGLSAALELDLKRVTFYCDYYPIFRYVMGHWSAKQRKVSALVTQVSQIREKFTHCQPSLIARNDVKFAFKLAREAIDSHLSKAAASSSSKKETCAICLEDTDLSQIFSIDTCMHRYCFSCMKQHVEVKMLHGVLPTCPHEDCKSELKIDSCTKFLTPRLIEIMSQRIKEASIPVTEKIYCPYPKCSALMSKREVLEYSKSALVGAERFGARKCIKCNGRFCVDCKVPWHNNMTCSEYKSRYRYTPFSETRLKSLAAKNLWRQCVKCNHMIELAAGCYHMTCRCGYEFCYTCGAEWKDKKATCSCPLWDEGYIIEDEFDNDEDEDLDEEDYDSDSDEHW